MTRSPDLVMVEREPTEAMLNAARDWSIAKYGIGIGNDAAIGCWQAMIAAALQSVEGGVLVAAKQESCPESAPRTETAIVTALRGCQRVLAMMIDPASIKSTSVIHAFAAATAAEAKARTVLDGVTKSDGGVEGHAGSDGSESSRVTLMPCGGDRETGNLWATPCPAGIKPGPSDTQLTKTPSADHDAGNLRDKLDIAISALEFARDGYERTDIKHIDYRVGVYTTACDALDTIALPSAPNHQPHAVSQGWRTDLENAPRKGRDIDLWHRQMNKRLTDCFWSHDDLPSHAGAWFSRSGGRAFNMGLDCEFSHWRELPAPPSPAKTGGAS